MPVQKIIFVVLVFLIACQSSKKTGTNSHTSEFVVLDSTQAQQSVSQCSRDAPQIQSGWNPSSQQIEMLEENIHQIEKHMAKDCCLNGTSLNKVNQYIRQYVGIVINDQKLIYINAFPKNEFKDWPDDLVKMPNWKEEAYIVCDGGDYYWGAVYNPETNTFSDLAFNGIG